MAFKKKTDEEAAAVATASPTKSQAPRQGLSCEGHLQVYGSGANNFWITCDPNRIQEDQGDFDFLRRLRGYAGRKVKITVEEIG